MNTSTSEMEVRAVAVSTTDDELIVKLQDGRTIIVPLSWYPRLMTGTPEQRRNCRLLGDGEYINWPDVDEDLTVAGLLRGIRAPQKRAG